MSDIIIFAIGVVCIGLGVSIAYGLGRKHIYDDAVEAGVGGWVPNGSRLQWAWTTEADNEPE